MEDAIKGTISARHGLAILGASLLAALAVVALVAIDDRDYRREGIDAEGRRLMGLLQTLPLESSSLEGLLGRYLKAVPDLESGSGFSFLAIRDSSGELQEGVLRAGAVLPSFPPPAGPSYWHGARRVRNGLDGRGILEYRAPILSRGELAGFLCLGYFEPGYGIGEFGYRRLAGLCLPGLLLGAFAYILFKIQTRPILALCSLVEKGEQGGGTQTLGKLTEQIDCRMARDSDRIKKLEEMYQEMLTSDKVRHCQVNRLDRVPALTGAAMEALLDAQDRLSGLGGSLKVINANSLILDIFLITGFSDYVEVVRSPYGD